MRGFLVVALVVAAVTCMANSSLAQGSWELTSIEINPNSIVIDVNPPNDPTKAQVWYDTTQASLWAETSFTGASATVSAIYLYTFTWVGSGTSTSLTVHTKGWFWGYSSEWGAASTTIFPRYNGTSFTRYAEDPLWYYDDELTWPYYYASPGGFQIVVPVTLTASAAGDYGAAYADAHIYKAP